MFRVFKQSPDGSDVFDFEKLDNAVRCCFFLVSEGYSIAKVQLPNGASVDGEEIMHAILQGLRAAGPELTPVNLAMQEKLRAMLNPSEPRSMPNQESVI